MWKTAKAYTSNVGKEFFERVVCKNTSTSPESNAQVMNVNHNSKTTISTVGEGR